MGYSEVILWLLIITVSADEQTDIQSIGKSSEIFAGKIYQKLASNTTSNLLVSPISVHTILALVQTGANGTTLDQMAETLSLPRDRTSVQRLFTTLQTSLRRKTSANDALILNTANKIYLRDDIVLAETFTESLQNFDAEVETLDLEKSPVEEINRWVESKTNSKIQNIVQDGDITVDTVMVLINALYFKGKWKTTFEESATHKRPFNLNEKTRQDVDMMHLQDYFYIGYNVNLDASFLEIPYTDEDFVLTFVLPKEVDGYKKLGTNIHHVLEPQRLYEEEVRVFIPRFKIEGENLFREPLEQLGMIEPFSNADFSGLTKQEKPITISKIIQKTFIEVNEEGTEAAAASAVYLVDRIFSSPREFNADHPFLFILKQKSTGIILFVGQYTTPPS